MSSAKAVIFREHYATTIHSSTHEIIADEPVSSGGTDLGLSPEALLASSLAACTCITLRMYADRKSLPLEKVEAHIIVKRDAAGNMTRIERKIAFTGNLSVIEKEKLLEIADHCPMHKLLTNPITIQTKLL